MVRPYKPLYKPKYRDPRTRMPVVYELPKAKRRRQKTEAANLHKMIGSMNNVEIVADLLRNHEFTESELRYQIDHFEEQAKIRPYNTSVIPGLSREAARKDVRRLRSELSKHVKAEERLLKEADMLISNMHTLDVEAQQIAYRIDPNNPENVGVLQERATLMKALGAKNLKEFVRKVFQASRKKHTNKIDAVLRRIKDTDLLEYYP